MRALKTFVVQMLQLLAWTLVAGLVIVTLGPIGLRPQISSHAQADRALAYLIVALALSVAYPRRHLVVLGFLVVLAILLELGQKWVPYRDPHLRDVLAKAFGAAAGVSIVSIGERIGRRFRRRSPAEHSPSEVGPAGSDDEPPNPAAAPHSSQERVDSSA